MGLPSVMPQVAFGWAISGALCRAMMVSNPARPGATILGPPLNPAKKWGLDEPGRDAHVGVHPVGVEPYGEAARRTAEVHQARRRRRPSG